MSEREGMPDVTAESSAEHPGRLDMVGMSGIEVPLCFSVQNHGNVLTPARADIFVDLVDPNAKGIHMSRLYLLVVKLLARNQLSAGLLEQLLCDCVDSHSDRSLNVCLRLTFEVPCERLSLKSGHVGWRNYPATVESRLQKGGRFRVWLTVQVQYSSTCPCSAALARQLIQARASADFAGQVAIQPDEVSTWVFRPDAICATPHSQRSVATVTVELDSARSIELSPIWLVDVIETSLKTPVQAAVKREDEQEFARLNGENLMFCEDAGRKMRAALDTVEEVLDFRIEARHLESLHPHDAVSTVVKGIPGGLSTGPSTVGAELRHSRL